MAPQERWEQIIQRNNARRLAAVENMDRPTKGYVNSLDGNANHATQEIERLDVLRKERELTGEEVALYRTWEICIQHQLAASGEL